MHKYLFILGLLFFFIIYFLFLSIFSAKGMMDAADEITIIESEPELNTDLDPGGPNDDNYDDFTIHGPIDWTFNEAIDRFSYLASTTTIASSVALAAAFYVMAKSPHDFKKEIKDNFKSFIKRVDKNAREYQKEMERDEIKKANLIAKEKDKKYLDEYSKHLLKDLEDDNLIMR